MAALIWLRRIVLIVLLAATLLVLYAAYTIVDSLVRVAVVGGYGFYVQTCLWLDRRITRGLESAVVAQTLRAAEHLTGFGRPR